jgi:hypothetical protein
MAWPVFPFGFIGGTVQTNYPSIFEIFIVGGGGDGGGDIESDADDSEGPGMAECRYQICSWDETQALLESNQELVLATCPGEKSQVTDAAVQRNAGTTSVAHETPDDVALVARCGEITEKMLRDHFHLPLHTVAKMFGMCTTAFKKLCRRFEIPKWPHRQVAHAAPHP